MSAGRKRAGTMRRLRTVALGGLLLFAGAGDLRAGGEKITIQTQAGPAATVAPAADIYLGTFSFTLNKSAPTADLTAITLTHYGTASAGAITNVRLLADGDADPGNGGTTQYGATVAGLSGNNASFSDPAPSVIWVGTGQQTIYAHVYADISSAAIGSTVGFELSSSTNRTWNQSYSDGTSYPVSLGLASIQVANTPPTATITTPANASSIGGPGPYSVTGTAADSDGTVSAVDVQISRAGPEYWNGSGWQAGAVWLPATGTTSWSYSWAWTTDMEGTAVAVTARATDDLAATGTDTNNTTVDSLAPRVATGVRFQTPPTSGDASFTLLSDWTETSAGTPEFSYFLDAGPYTGWVNGTGSNSSSYTVTTALDGADWFQGIRSRHADTWANGPTQSEDTGPFYVLPLTPNAPTVANNGTQTSLDVTVVANPGETGAGMLYAVRCHDAGGTPTGWVDSSTRVCTASPDWQTTGIWGSPIVVGGLTAGTQYGFSVASGNPNDLTPTTGERSASAYGATASATTTAGNTPPTVSITSPADTASFNQGDNVNFAGTASDLEDGPLTASLAWTSSIDGSIGTGGSFSRSDLSVGTHTITASVTDSGSLSGQDQISITINAVVNTVTPAAPTAAIDSCNQITVQVAYTGDSNGNSETLFERSPNGSSGWTAIAGCGSVGGPSPRACVDTTVADSSINYYRVDFTDSDGVVGTDPSAAIGPYDTTPFCGVDGTTVGTPQVEESSCSQLTVLARFTGDDNADGSTLVETSLAGADTWSTACAGLSGPSPRSCSVAELAETTSYDVRLTYTDLDGVTGTNPETVASVSTRACGVDGVAPTILVLSPSRGAVLTGTDRVKVQVYDGVGVSTVQWMVDATDDGSLAATTVNASYDCGAGCAVYEFDLDTSALAAGAHFLTVKATDGAGNAGRSSQGFRTNAAGGDGRLLRRTRGSQLCVDCHDVVSHSSQATSGKYGNWAIACDTCHTPHRTKNIFLIRDEVETPSSGKRPVRFESTTGAVASSGVPGSASYANEDNASQADGPCQVCHTRTKSSGGAARWRNADAGGNVDTHFGSASTGQCTGCHSHAAGFSGAGGACNSCHNAPPTVGKHGVHDQVWNSTEPDIPTAYDEDVSHATATQYGFACAECHSNDSADHFPSEPAPYTVDVLFKGTAPANPGAGYTPDAPSRTTDPGVNGDGWYWSNGTCANVYCHSDADRIGTVAYQSPSPRWDQAGSLTCTSCHDDGVSTTLSGAHAKHVDSATYQFGCVRCHDATLDTAASDIQPLAIADKTQHVDGTRTIQFDPSPPNNSGGSYSQLSAPSYTCSNTYCHSNGQGSSPPYTSGPSIAWNTTANCRSCHSGDAGAAPTMDSGKHENHVNNTAIIGTNYECATCHDQTVSAGANETITNFGNHVDGTKTVAGTFVDATYSSPTCTSSYCHSSGQAPPPATTSFENYPTPDWFTATVDALDCKGCHGRHSENAFASVAGEPNYTNDGAGTPDANSHNRHVTAAADCTKCHNSTTTTGTAILASAPHTNQTRNVVIAPAYDTGDPNYTAGTKTCSNVACHGAGTPQWGATLVCLDCHTGIEGGSLGDGTPNAVDDNWTATNPNGSVGHGGLPSGTGNSGPLTSTRGGCDYCHQLNAAHTPTVSANPYRLRFSATDNTLCLRCHENGDPGIELDSDGVTLTLRNGNVNVDTAHYRTAVDGGKHEGTEGGKLCWDCHDPHGVPSNILMIKSAVSKNASAYGVPGTTVTVNFTDNTTPGPATGRFVELDAPISTTVGICQACHDPAGQGTSGPTKYWRSDGTDDPDGPGGNLPYQSGQTSGPNLGHNQGALCTNCHKHNDNFKGAGGGPDCRGCHGTQSQGGRRTVDADFANGTTPNFRSHHVGNGLTMGGTFNNYDCVVCHAEGQVLSTAGSDDCPSGAIGSTCTNPTYHTNKKIDLRDVDSIPVQDGAVASFQYDKDAVAASAGAAANWNSSNSLWRAETSGCAEGADSPSTTCTPRAGKGLDRFCLTCHDALGASQIANFRANTSQTTLNPFADTIIGNNYDQIDRTRVTDIASRVVAGGGSLDAPGDERYDQTPTGDSIPDPPQGIYSRHAVRGQSRSVYQTGAASGKIPAAFWQGTWNDASVMGCADCHTVDGANTTSGNAHGSDSEYLLKNRGGLAIEGTLGNSDYNCYQCHTVGNYSGTPHTSKSADWVDSTAAVGSAGRINKSGNIYGFACTNCHGGILQTAADANRQFGTIHGTSQTMDVYGVVSSSYQKVGTRRAYRFMNGNSLRFYQPDTTDTSGGGPFTTWSWGGTQSTCYTIATTDSFGGCTQHGSKSASAVLDKPVVRSLKY